MLPYSLLRSVLVDVVGATVTTLSITTVATTAATSPATISTVIITTTTTYSTTATATIVIAVIYTFCSANISTDFGYTLFIESVNYENCYYCYYMSIN